MRLRGFLLIAALAAQSPLSLARTYIQNISKDKAATHKALDYDREKDLRHEKYDREKDLRKEKKAARLELKEYRRRIFQLKKEIAFEGEQAREYQAEAKALRAELKEDIKKRNELKESAESGGGAFASFASNVVLGGDITGREGNKQRLHAYNQLIKVKKAKIRELRAAAKKFIGNKKVKRLEIAEIRGEMAILAEDSGLRISKRKTSAKRKVSSQ